MGHWPTTWRKTARRALWGKGRSSS